VSLFSCLPDFGEKKSKQAYRIGQKGCNHLSKSGQSPHFPLLSLLLLTLSAGKEVLGSFKLHRD